MAAEYMAAENKAPDPEALSAASFYTPKDLATTWSLLSVTTLGNCLIASYFIPYLPLWMPLTWLALALSTGGIQLWCATRPILQRWPLPQRLHIERGIFWLSQICMGSAAYLLYVPGNLGMLGVLNVCVVVIGAMSVLQFSGDHWRGAIGAALAVLPTATRYFFEDSWLLFSLGIGGYVVVVALSMFGHMQYKALIEQAALRKRAEIAVDATAAVGLAKARFFAAVSHDLRQPVHAIGLYLAPLLNRAQDAASQKALSGIYQSWHALDDLLSQVLDLTRMDADSLHAELAPVEVAPLLRGLVMQHSAVAERKSIRIVAMAMPGRYVLADVLMLKRVLSNLLDNAIKFSLEDGRVVLVLRSVQDCWCIQVRDAGVGIAADLQAKVFEEFVQLSNPERDRSMGFGLGLSIARRFMALMQGEMVLRSRPGQGTCISVYLPKANVAALDTLHARSSSHSPNPSPAVQAMLQLPSAISRVTQASGHSILVVEDDVLVTQAMLQLLSELGLPILHAANAADALVLSAKVCMAVCDVRLPGATNGLELALQLQQRGVPCLLMSGETSAEIRQAAQVHGLALLIKPVKPQALLDGLGALALRTLH